MHRESCVVVALPPNPQQVAEMGWKRLVEGLRTNLERMREQPKYPPLPEDDE